MRSFGVSKSERGQALLIIVLIMVIALTVGLSVATRSITNLRTTTEEANSAQALSAAEAGLERSLSTNASVAISGTTNTAAYTTSVNSLSGVQILLNNGNIILQDEGVDLWFVAHECGSDSKSPCWNTATPFSPLGNVFLTVYWGSAADSCSTSPPTAPALEIAVVEDFSALRFKRYVIDPCTGSSRAAANNFDDSSIGVGGDIQGKPFAYSKTLSPNISSGLIARIIPLYGNTAIGINAGSGLPSQGAVISSTGTFGTGTNQIIRKLSAYQPYPALPAEYFTYGIFSPTN